MATKENGTRMIPIRIEKGRIELGERYAFALEMHSRLDWRCDRPFAVSFDWDAPFTVRAIGTKRATLRFLNGVPLRPNHAYPYVISAYDKGKVINSIGIVIVKPPRPLPTPPGRRFLSLLPGIVIVRPPRP